MWAKQKGFTIVELLIVIVIIGILAAIVIVAYNGIQQRANNAQRTTAAKEWQKIIGNYLALNNSYPAGTLNNHTCLGTGNPTDFDANPDEDCNGTGNIKHPNAAINNAYMTIAAKLPTFPPAKLVSTSTGTVAGIAVRSIDTLDPLGTPKIQYPMLHYWLIGNNQDCILRPVAQAVAGGWVSTSASSTANDGALTRCIIVLPDPSAL